MKQKKAIYDQASARVGFLSDCLCFDCLQRQNLDFKKDEKKCCSCSSVNVKSLRDLSGPVCPKCKEGVIRRDSDRNLDMTQYR